MRNKIIGIALGLAIAAGAIAWHSCLDSPKPRLLSEVDGAIRAVAIQYTRESSSFTSPCYRAFLSQLEPSTEVIVVCGDASDAKSFRETVLRGIRAPRDIKSVVVGKPITTWCKDRFLVGIGEPASLLHPPASSTALSTRANDALVAPTLAGSFPSRFRATQVPLLFDAGDILPTASKVIVSDTLWAKNSRPSAFRARLKRLFGHEVVWLKGVPDHHIGMYAAPLDEKTVVVGDPDLGRALWSPDAERKLGKADFSAHTVIPFRKAAEQLRAAGFRVIAAPLVVLGPRTYLTYTNGVFEKRGSRCIVYTPTYGDAKLDRAAQRAYESAGCEVRPIPVRTVYRFRGTMGCLVNVLQRV